jgi:hypothetical protein
MRPPDPPLIAFLEAAARRGVRVAGLVQERACDDGLRALKDARVRDLVTGDTLDMQDLAARRPDARSIRRRSRVRRTLATACR